MFRVPILRTILNRLIYNHEYGNIDEELTDSNVGARRNRNIRDNIFVLNAVTNAVVKGDADPVDVQVYDVEKCFDALWMQECINDVFETGFNNDKLPLLFLENRNAQIAIKTPHGITSRKNISNCVMQGTVWGSLFCTTTMDKLGKMIYKNDDLLYKYKNQVDIPSLGMVDDIMSIQKCSMDAVKTNAVINAFIESKKLTLSHNKCHRIHVGKKSTNHDCPDLKVHDLDMKNSDREKYLGDLVDKSGKVRATIEERQKKGYAIVAEILAILEDIPLGKHKMEIGLELRQAMLLNGMLYNSEVWHSITENEIKMLEKVDEHLLRALVKGHAKTPLEFLFLEAGATPLRFLISCRRILYLQNILKRPQHELIRRVYDAQKVDTLPGDFYQLVQGDFALLGKQVSEEYIMHTSKELFKKEIKILTRKAAFQYLKNLQAGHSKVRDIVYETFETQTYMKSPLFMDEEVNLLHSLRSRAVPVKCNLSSIYTNNLLCPLCEVHRDDQSHLLVCSVLKSKLTSNEAAQSKIVYEDIFADHQKQKQVTYLLKQLIKIRESLVDESFCKVSVPSTSDGVLGDSDYLPSIVHYPSGK